MFSKPFKITRIAATASLLFILLSVVSCKKDEMSPPPVAKAGKADTITLPLDSVQLNGSATGSKIVAYAWTQVSGPSTAVISDDGNASTMVKGLVVGRYVFQLVVTDDKGLSGSDTTSVVVNPAPIKTLTLQPANNPGEFTLAYLNNADGSNIPDVTISGMAWTYNGTPYYTRGLLKFDLSSISSSATILSANLYLYSDISNTTGDRTDANYGTNNALRVGRITSNWSSATANWSNQPTTDAANEILVPSTTASRLDLNLDVTNMVSAMVKNNANYGFMMQLQNEVAYTSRIFMSSHDNPSTTLYPKIVVVYKP
jgi:hypothetical protein